MKEFKSSGIVVLFLLLLVGLSCVYTIQEGQHGVLLRLEMCIRDRLWGFKTVLFVPTLRVPSSVILQQSAFARLTRPKQ